MVFKVKIVSTTGVTLYNKEHSSNSSISAMNEAINRYGRDILEQNGLTVEVERVEELEEESTTVKFEAGKTYYTYTMGMEIRKFVCTEVSSCGEHIVGSFNGEKDKIYKAEEFWKTASEQKEGKQAEGFRFLADNRYILYICSTISE